MAREYNESSYYRANPYYQQGYLPSSAFNNRKELDYMSEMPQGREYFVITGKKHYQHLSHKSNIQEDHLMQYIEETPMLAKAKSKGYFRSLNITDIEGASTNTLISQGVKNKLKALEQLKR